LSVAAGAAPEISITRDPDPQVGFGGGGPHFCLGRHLAALELRLLFDALATRMPDLALGGEPRCLRPNFLSGIKQMPVCQARGRQIRAGRLARRAARSLAIERASVHPRG
jgi:cholest-4-en-3-one 26-monooxygenase